MAPSPTRTQPATLVLPSPTPSQSKPRLTQPGIKEALADPTLPKDLHDLKAVLRALAPHDVSARRRPRRRHAPQLPHQSHPRLPHPSRYRCTQHQPRTSPSTHKRQSHRPQPSAGSRGCNRPPRLHTWPSKSPNIPQPNTTSSGRPPQSRRRCHTRNALRRQENRERSNREQQTSSTPYFLPPTPLLTVYDTIDKPLVSVLLRMEQAGVRIDPEFLRRCLLVSPSRSTISLNASTSKPARPWAARNYRFNINSPKQLGDVLFNKMQLPKPMKYGKGKVVSTAAGCTRRASRTPHCPRTRPRIPPACEAQVNLPRLTSSTLPIQGSRPYHLQSGRHCDRPSLVNKSQSRRTFPSAPQLAGRSARPSFPHPAMCSCLPITPKSSCD